MTAESSDEPTEWAPGCGWPSPAEIDALTAEIRAGWSARERRKRRVVPEGAVEVPTVSVAEIAAARG